MNTYSTLNPYSELPSNFLKHPEFKRPKSYVFKDSDYLILLDRSSDVPFFGGYLKYSLELNDDDLPVRTTAKMDYQSTKKHLNRSKSKCIQNGASSKLHEIFEIMQYRLEAKKRRMDGSKTKHNRRIRNRRANGTIAI